MSSTRNEAQELRSVGHCRAMVSLGSQRYIGTAQTGVAMLDTGSEGKDRLGR